MRPKAKQYANALNNHLANASQNPLIFMFEKERTNYLQSNGFEAIGLKAVLFDMDGVLFNSMPNHARSWHEALKPYGLQISPEEAYLHEGRTGADTINILAKRCWGREASEEECKTIYKSKSEMFASCPPAKPMTGALELLRKVKAEGIKIVVVTGSGQQSLLNRLDKNFPNIFSTHLMVTSFDVKHGKPNPEPYLIGMKKAGIEPWEGLVVENAPLGVTSATAAKIFTVAVNTGPLPDKVLRDAGANLLFHSMQELYEKWDEVSATFKCKKTT